MNDTARALHARLVRNWRTIEKVREHRDPLYDTLCARLARGTAARQLGMSVDTLAPGKRGCPYHLHHAQEEAFVVLDGRGSVRVAGETLPIEAGDVVFVPAGPDYPHQIVNTSDAPLTYLSISTQESPEVCEYPDSGKVMSQVRHEGHAPFARMHRLADDLDYWEGEP